MGETLPVISGMQARRAFERDGWVFKRQKGSHMILSKTGLVAHLSIPNHATLDRGLLRGLIRNSGLTVEQFRVVGLDYSTGSNLDSQPCRRGWLRPGLYISDFSGEDESAAETTELIAESCT